MRKVSQRAGWLAALGVVVGITAASPGEAATGPMKLPFPDPPMVGEPDTPPHAPNCKIQIEWRMVWVQPRLGTFYCCVLRLPRVDVPSQVPTPALRGTRRR
jgi:hypothetical protein